MGTLTARTALRVRSNPVFLVIAWSLLMLLCGGVSLTIYGATARTVTTTTMMGTNQSSFDMSFEPQGRWYGMDDEEAIPTYRLELQGDVSGSIWNECSLRIVPDDGPRVFIDIDVPQRTWTIEGLDDPTEGSGFDLESVTQFFEAAEIETSSPELQLEMQQVSTMLEMLADVGANSTEAQNWGLGPDPYQMQMQNMPGVEPVLMNLGSSSMSSHNGFTERSYQRMNATWSPDERPIEISAAARYDEGGEGQPTTLNSIEVKIQTAVGWPLRIEADPQAGTWSATYSDESWTTGTLPCKDADVRSVLDQLVERTKQQLPDDIAPDVARLVNLRDDQLVGFTGWQAQRFQASFEEQIGLRSTGGSWGGGGGWGPGMGMPPGTVMRTRPVLWPFVAIAGGFFAFWALGLWRIFTRRARLLRIPATTPAAA